jgi:glycosyltransferase involved in cell wall biosynthesis
MMTGTPIIAPKTGGLTRQVVDYRDGSENGVALDIDFKTLVGSQAVPYIYEDYVDNKKIANAMMILHDMDDVAKRKLSHKVKKYASEAFDHETTVGLWHETMLKTITDFKNRKNWTIEEI